jgi:uncharacterized repeat protein (TIGR01451 family)
MQIRISIASLFMVPGLFLAGCSFGGGGGHHGQGGGSGQNTVGLAFSNPPTSLTLLAGSGGTLTFVITNNGGLASSGTTLFTMTLATGGSSSGVTFNPKSSGGSGWDCCTSTSAQVNCTNSAVIQPASSTSPLTLALSAAANAVSLVTQPTFSNPSVTTGLPGRSYNLEITVITPPNVRIVKKHVGSNFIAGDQGQYALTVTNAGGGEANNTAITDNLPTGLNYVSFSNGPTTTGSGGMWACSASGQTVTCTLAAALNAGAMATPLTLNVAVPADFSSSSVSNTASITAQYDTGTAAKSSTDTVTVVLPSGSVTVTMTEPGNTSVSVGTGGTIDFSAALQNFKTNQINWSVDGVQGGDNTNGTITATTQSGGVAVYTAPANVPAIDNPVTVTATAADNTLAYSSVSVTITSNQNSAMKGQFAFTMHGFQQNGLPFAAIGTFIAAGDSAGSLTNIYTDVNVAQSTTPLSSVFQSKVQWQGNYSMDSATHGIMHLSQVSDSTKIATISFELSPKGTFGYLAENDSPGGSVGSGEFRKQDPTSFNTMAGAVAGSWIFRHGRGHIGRLSFAATSKTAATVTGQEDDSSGGQDTISRGTLTIDPPDASGYATGHATLTLPLVSEAATVNESVYIVGGANGAGLMYMEGMGTQSGNTPTGSLAYQTMSSGYTNANAFLANSAFALEGVDASGAAPHSIVCVGQLATSALGPGFQEIGIYCNDAGQNTTAGALGNGGGFTYTMDAAGTGRGTITLTSRSGSQIPLTFYLQAPSDGYLLESTTSTSSEDMAGFLEPQTTQVFNPASPASAIATAQALMPATTVGVSDFLMTADTTPGKGKVTNGSEDTSLVGLPAAFDLLFAGNYVLGGGLDGPGAGNLSVGNGASSTSPTMFGGNYILMMAGSNGKILAAPIYYGNAASVLDPSLILILAEQ